MDFYVMTLFPEVVEHGLNVSILGRAMEKEQIRLHTVNIRDYSLDKHKRVDDYPYGGGAGMVMTPEPVVLAAEAVLEQIAAKEKKTTETVKKNTKIVYMTPWGKPFTQRMAESFAQEDNLVFLCGHYEGIDERALEEIATDFVSAGDFILTGGELPAMMMIDAVARLLPGVLHNTASAEEESFSDDLLEYPQYTRPEIFRGRVVPEVLLSGHHKNIESFRKQQSLLRTQKYRPDLLKASEFPQLP